MMQMVAEYLAAAPAEAGAMDRLDWVAPVASRHSMLEAETSFTSSGADMGCSPS
ncbi:hypothetical protein P7L75_02810 (plasmid) [Tistrella mobilis]|uniref:hypothetical protein n=1 Tax=Tistrella mobilis TaxID=171437 RepID=UPI003558141E